MRPGAFYEATIKRKGFMDVRTEINNILSSVEFIELVPFKDFAAPKLTIWGRLRAFFVKRAPAQRSISRPAPFVSARRDISRYSGR